MKIAVYSNFYGGDHLINGNFNPVVAHTYPHFFYTNNAVAHHKAQGAGWTAISVPTPVSADPAVSNMQCKLEKVMPHILPELRGFDILIYRDAKMKGLDFAMLPKIISRMQAINAVAAFVVHPRCVIDEVVESMFQPRYLKDRSRIVGYVNEELAAGWAPVCPIHHGCNISVRNQRHEDTEAMNTTWMRHIERCGVQDQISFHFIAQMFKILPIPGEFGYRRSEVAVPGWE